MTFYLRVDGVDHADLSAEDGDEVAFAAFRELEARGFDVEAVVPYLREDAHERLEQAETSDDRTPEEAAEEFSAEFLEEARDRLTTDAE